MSAPLDRLLAEVRADTAEHHRTSYGGPVPPWSDADEETLTTLDPRWLRAAADELDRVRTDLREVGAELDRLAGEAVGDAAASVCARLAATSHERADVAEALAGEMRGAGGRLHDLLDGIARRVLRALDTEDQPPPWAPSRCEPPRCEPAPSESAARYPTLLRSLRAGLADALGALPELLADRPARPATPPGWAPDPGYGPRLPDVAAHRVEPGYGVRIARLPDRPPG